MKRSWRTLGITLTLVAFVLGFAGTFVTLNVTQPAAQDTASSVQFAVRPGDGASSIASRLASAGLINNAAIFTLLAGLQHLDAHLRPGIYQLSPDMTMGAIIQRLVGGHPDQVLIIVPPGKSLVQIPPGTRVAQFPAYLATLPNVKSKAALSILTTGVLPTGKRLSDLYWYVRPRQAGTVAALEGYILPGTYFIDTQADESAAVQQLLNGLGEHLCPGPDAAHLDAYLLDHTQCKAHAATVGPKGVNIFTEMDQRYHTSDDATGLYETLTLASLVVRISTADGDAAGVAGVYYNRYLAANGSGYAPNGEYVPYMDAPATVQYAQDTDSPPAADNWWAPLTTPPGAIELNSAYNTAVPDNRGLMPGPIAAPTWADVAAAASAGEPAASPYFYVVADRCGQAHYAATQAEFLVTARQSNMGCFNN
jgi:UPF0755 protein